MRYPALVHFNVAQREILLKVVYYGPPLSGKTTNLQAIHRLMNPARVGHLTTLNTTDDRTLFFDLLPLTIATDAGYQIKLKLFTVPGQVVHAATRKIVLAGADGVAFIADSQRSQQKLNNDYWHGMRRFLTESGLPPDELPTVIQFNKRDLPDVRSDEELLELQKRSKEPLYPAVAVRGDGVLETLRGLLERVFYNLNQRYDFENKFKLSATQFLHALDDTARAPAQTSERTP